MLPPSVTRSEAGQIGADLRALGVDNADDVRQVIETSLGRGRYAPIFDALLPVAVKLAELKNTATQAEFEHAMAERHAFLHRLGVFNGLDPQELTSRLPGFVDRLANPNLGSISPPRRPRTTHAWDLMRIQAYGANAIGCGWLPVEEYNDFAHRAVTQLQNSFASWVGAAASFWWGQQIWLADRRVDPLQPQQLSRLFAIALHRPDSPWVLAPLHA